MQIIKNCKCGCEFTSEEKILNRYQNYWKVSCDRCENSYVSYMGLNEAIRGWNRKNEK